MPRIATKLTQLQINRLKSKHKDRPTLYPVGGVSGLHWQITPHEGRSWALRVSYGGKRRWIGLGSYPAVKLEGAYKAALELKDKIAIGIDPIAERRGAKAKLASALTFKAVVEAYTPIKQSKLAAGKYSDQWADSLHKYAVPILGDMPVRDVALADVLRVLQPMWAEKTATAEKLQHKMNEVLDYAAVIGQREGPNPARWKGNLSLALEGDTSVAVNYPALQLKNMAQWWADLLRREGASARALQWQALTATRTGAVRFLTWEEIDLDAKLWTIQPGRQSSKIPRNGKAKRVPLSKAALAILGAVGRRDDSPYVFPAVRGGALSDAALGAVMKKIHVSRCNIDGVGYVDEKTSEPAVPHGLRSAFRVWAREKTTYDPDLAEVALWHSLGGKVQQAYDRSDMLEKRRAMMEDWAQYLVYGDG